MAEVVYWLGHATTSTARVCMRADTTGTYVVTCNGSSENVAIDTGVDYGTGYAEFTGLATDTAYPFTVSLSGTQQTAGTLRTAPAAGASFYVAFGSCMQASSDMLAMYAAVRDYDVRALFLLGDTPYSDAGMDARWANSSLSGSYAAPGTADTWHAQYLRMHRDMPAFRFIAERVPLYRMWDDHDALCNDFDHELAATNATYTANSSPTFATQADVDAAFNRGRQAFDAWSIGNPATAWAHAADQKPYGAAAGTAASNYPAQYYSVTMGAATFHVVDCISHRGTIAQSDAGTLIEDSTAAKTMLGLPQMRGLKSQLMKSATAFNPIMSGKCTYRGAMASDNHGWSDCATEREALLDWIAKFARGVVWGTGDVHTPYIINTERHAMVNSSPIGQSEHDGTGAPALGSGYAEGVVWKADGPTGAQEWDGTPRCLGLVHVTPTHLDWVLISDRGQELTRWRQYPNANVLTRLW